MNIVSSTVRHSQPVRGRRVERDLVVEISAFGVDQARAAALHRLQVLYPEARFQVLGHEVLKRPSEGRTWTEKGNYRIILRAKDLLEDLR